jgi:hypothetical protein
LQDDDALAEEADHRQVVGDEQVAHAQGLLHLGEQVEHLRLHGQVERAHRLVADHELRRDDQRAGDGDALALAAREVAGVARGGVVGEPDAPEHVGDARLDLLGGQLAAALQERLGHRRPDAAGRVERAVGILEHGLQVERERTSPPAARVGDVLAVEVHGPGARGQQA